MTALGLIAGKVWRAPESRPRKPPSPSPPRSSARAPARGWCGNVVGFGESAAELLKLKDGDVVSVSGPFTVEIYQNGAQPRINHRIVADRIAAPRLYRRKGTPRRLSNRWKRTASRSPNPRQAGRTRRARNARRSAAKGPGFEVSRASPSRLTARRAGAAINCEWIGPENGNSAGGPPLTAYVYRDKSGAARFRKLRTRLVGPRVSGSRNGTARGGRKEPMASTPRSPIA
jgi:hypothetical protein